MLFLLLFILNYFICYPGILTADSYGQYKQSIDLNFNNHHPPLMSIIWHYLNLIYNGPQPMLLLSLGMIWVSVFLLYESFKKEYPKSMSALLLIPFTPGILSNSAVIWKDVLFGNSILLALSLATYCFFQSVSKKIRLTFYLLSLFLVYFGASMKFQGQFLVPILICIITYSYFKVSISKVIMSSLVALLAFYGANTLLDKHFKVQDVKSAQLRQFFDLAAVCVCINEDLFPTFIKTDPRYSFDKIKKNYNYVEVNGLTGSNDDKLFSGTTDHKALNLNSGLERNT